MPELPEVETVRAGLEHIVTGRRIVGVSVLHPRPVRRHEAGPDAFAAALAGALATAIALNAGAAYTYALRALEAYQVNQNP